MTVVLLVFDLVKAVNLVVVLAFSLLVGLDLVGADLDTSTISTSSSMAFLKVGLGLGRGTGIALDVEEVSGVWDGAAGALRLRMDEEGVKTLLVGVGAAVEVIMRVGVARTFSMGMGTAAAETLVKVGVAGTLLIAVEAETLMLGVISIGTSSLGVEPGAGGTMGRVDAVGMS